MKITFFCRVDRKALDVVGFYKQDIDILQALGYEVKIATNYFQIDWRSDVIFIWWWTYALIPALIGRMLRKKVVITGTFNYRCPDAPMDFFRRNWLQRFLIKSAVHVANINVIVSKHETEMMKNEWKLKNIYYSPHIIDTEIYSPVATIRKSSLVFSLIWTGKQNMIRKCLPEIIDSAKKVLQQFPDMQFIIAGRKGDGYEEALKLIEEKGVNNNVKLIGEISEEDKINYLRSCTLYLQPSRFEGFGLAIAEAMSCGASVITSNSGAVSEVAGNAAIVLNSIDPDIFSKEMIRLLQNSSMREELGKKASERIRTHFPFSRRLKDLENLLSDNNKH